MIKEFKAFIMRGNVIDMAVGLIVGAAFGKIVSSLVTDVLMPPMGMVLGGLDFSDLSITLKAPLDLAKPVVLRYGLFINNVVDFLIVSVCVFLVVQAANSMKKTPPAPSPTEKNCPHCLMMIPIAAKKCGHCTSTI